MAVFTREKAQEVARLAIKRESETGNFTVIIIGNNGFQKLKYQVITSSVDEVRLAVSRARQEFGENVISLTKETLENPKLKPHTITGLTHILYTRVNNEIAKIMNSQIDRLAKDSLVGLRNLGRRGR